MRKEAAIEVNCVPVEHFLKLLKSQKKLVSDLEAFGVEAIEMENQNWKQVKQRSSIFRVPASRVPSWSQTQQSQVAWGGRIAGSGWV